MKIRYIYIYTKYVTRFLIFGCAVDISISVKFVTIFLFISPNNKIKEIDVEKRCTRVIAFTGEKRLSYTLKLASCSDIEKIEGIT